uniref:Uncharacterized protein n=1 Tax=Arion vulgaris TaxID=1028688 RepID=A0A0B6ZJG3_9EUPU
MSWMRAYAPTEVIKAQERKCVFLKKGRKVEIYSLLVTLTTHKPTPPPSGRPGD